MNDNQGVRLKAQQRTAGKRWLFAAFLAAAGLMANQLAAQQPTSSQADLETTADGYLQTWNSQGKLACEAKQADCADQGQVLVKAAAAFDAARRIDKAIQVRKLILEPSHHLDQTEYGKNAAFELAKNYQGITEYTLAADLYEASARKYPAMAQAPGALREAVLLRLGLGDSAQAVKDAEVFEKNYGAKQPGEAVTLWLAVASYFIEHEEFDEVKSLLAKTMSKVDRFGALDDKVVAHAWYGRALSKLGDLKGAEREYTTVRGLWKDPQGATSTFPEGAAGMSRLARALGGVGEAVFFFAEKKRAEVDAIRFPIFRGNATREAIVMHVGTKVAEWVRVKQRAIDEAEKAYAEVLALQPMPPPKWVIASGARVGTMWGKFVAEFRAAPIPNEWKRNGPLPGSEFKAEEIRRVYYEQLDQASEPQKQRAKAAFKKCVDFSVKFQYKDEYSRACEAWLSKSYPTQFPPVEELIPAPHRSSSRSLATPMAEPSRDK